MSHAPVLLNEVLENLDPRPNQNFIDATVGGGGHSKEILKLTAPKGKLLAIDRDIKSIEMARANLSEFLERIVFVNDSFGNLADIVKNNEFDSVDGILFDFGMSSDQLENSGKGFSFQKDEILDMRFDERSSTTAEDIVNDYGESELSEIFEKWGEETKAKRIARAIVDARRKKRIKTTRELAEIIFEVYGRRGRLHPATLVFQALRIEVNGELEEIEKVLAAVPEILKNGGRGAFISFHSLEDRLVKNWSRDSEKKGIISILHKKPVTASEEEVSWNPRSRSAKMRLIRKL